MIFSDDLNIFRKELQELLPFSAAYDCSRVRPLLADAEQTYLLPLLGEPLYERIVLLADGQIEAVHLCRKAVVNIAVYENFTLLNTQILPGGFSRLTGENTGSLYKYQEQDLKAIFRRNGFDLLDGIVVYFIKNLAEFPEFKESEYYSVGRGNIIPDRFVFSRYYKNIGNIVFRHLQPFIRRAEDLDLSQVVDIVSLRSGMLAEQPEEQLLRKLEFVRPVVVCLAVAYAIDDMGVNISDAGVWLENRVAADGVKEQNSLYVAQTISVTDKYRQMAERYLKELQKHLSGVENSVNPLARDNKDKKTMWL